MYEQEWMTAVAAVVAVVALSAVLVLSAQLRRTRASVRALECHVLQGERNTPPVAGRKEPEETVRVVTGLPTPREDNVVVTSEGRTFVLPSTEQVVNATMSRPAVRGAVVSHGILHALRPESRDRIRGLVRREFRSRRKARQRAGRRAARVAPVGHTEAQAWLGTHEERRAGP